MLVLGHMGVGRKLVSPVTRGLSQRLVLVGTILPDLIDKPLYYGLSLLLGKSSTELGLISGARTFGHTALFLLLLVISAFIKRSKLLAALCLGIASHLILDRVSDYFGPHSSYESVKAMFWPFFGWNFPASPYTGISNHFADSFSANANPFLFWGEFVGGFLLLWDGFHGQLGSFKFLKKYFIPSKSKELSSQRLRKLFQEYESFHKTPGNKITHYFGITFIVVGLLGILGNVVFGSDILSIPFYFRLDGGIILILGALAWYLFIDWKIAIPFSLVVFGLYFLGRALPANLNWGLFIFGWVLQAIGHAVYEKRSPAFLRNLTHLLIGPLWIFSKLINYK